jgi:lysophospholipase L1-like esterase
MTIKIAARNESLPYLMAAAQHSGTSDYGRDLKTLAGELGGAYFDMTTPWIQYMRSSGLHPHLFYRDRVHANPFGEQILAKIMLSWWAP